MKKIYFFIILLSFGIYTEIRVQAQAISPYLIGNNAWYDASLTNLWNKMANAKFGTIRVGGNAAERYGSNFSKYLGLIDGIRSANAEPIVQIPHSLTRQEAIDFITYINVTGGKNVKIWSISNEPDLASNSFGDAIAVSTYIKRIASALKSVDPSIIICGPETSWFQNTAYMTPLIGGTSDITGKDEAGNYYIDVVTWHKYMFTNIVGLESDVNTMVSKINTINLNRPADKKLSWGLTEFNTTYDNSKNTLGPDQNVWSFHAGQLFAEIYGLGMRKGAYMMNAWSMLEGQVEREGTDLSLFEKNYKGRSNYYHSLMLGQNMKLNYATTVDNQDSVVVIPMNDVTGTAVMILNKAKTTGFNFTLRLDNGSVSKSNALNINVNAGIDAEMTGNIAKYSTLMLVFDPAGKLVKRYTYTSSDADNRGEPLIETVTDDVTSIVSQQEQKIQLFPNPSTGDFITVNLQHFADNERIKIEIVNCSGKIVYSEKESVNQGESTNITLKNKSIPEGSYILSVQSKAKFFREKLIIKR